MRFTIFALTSIGVAVFSITNVAHASHTRAESSVVTSDPISNSTVNIYCRLKMGRKIFSSTGSGVMIGSNGIILTNAHVAQYFLLAKEKGPVKGWCAVRTGSPANEMYTADILYLSPTWLTDNIRALSSRVPKGTGEHDFALLYITGAYKKGAALPASYATLPLRTQSTSAENSAVTIAGYPTQGLKFNEMRTKLKLVSATSTITNNLSFKSGLVDVIGIAPSRAGSQGVSGGPVVDSEGTVAGIVTTKSSDSTALRAITASYIDRAVLAETGHSLAELLREIPAQRAAITRALITPETIADLVKSLRQRK
jgi:S1-C subfamily serine protease